MPATDTPHADPPSAPPEYRDEALKLALAELVQAMFGVVHREIATPSPDDAEIKRRAAKLSEVSSRFDAVAALFDSPEQALARAREFLESIEAFPPAAGIPENQP